MLKNLLFLSGIFCLFIFPSCNQYKTTNSGIKYKIISDSSSASGERGGMIIMDFILKDSKDSIFMNTYSDENGPKRFLLNDKYLPKALALLSVGDSAQFLVSADSLFAAGGGELPQGVDKGSQLTLYVKVRGFQTQKEVEDELLMQEELEKHILEQYGRDTTAIVKYLEARNIHAKKTLSGVYYVIHQNGKGLPVNHGDTINVHYTGKLMDGTAFDSSIGGSPYTVAVGESNAIPGWHEGLMHLKKGDKATFYIPSALAYGPYERPGIPPNSPLIFEIEIMND